MPTCTNCGHENADGQKFCGNCGTRLPEPVEATQAGGGINLQDNVINRSHIDASQTHAPTSVGGIHFNMGGAAAHGQVSPVFCGVCGFRIDDPELRCPRCKEFVHTHCYLQEQRMCESCFAGAQAPAPPPPAGEPEPAAPSLPTEITEAGIEMVLVPEGAFMMGGDEDDDEKPVHEVWLDSYYIGTYPVTNAQYRAFVRATGHREPEHWTEYREFAGDEQPVVRVSWDDATAFCRWLSRESGEDYYLSTEAQWEKAARGTDGPTYPWGEQEPSSRCCNFGRQVGRTTEVGSYPAGVSPYGCHDMAGNVWEWCADWYDLDYYTRSPERNPEGPASGERRVLRGGSWGYCAVFCRAARRRYGAPGGKGADLGFRVARSCR